MITEVNVRSRVKVVKEVSKLRYLIDERMDSKVLPTRYDPEKGSRKFPRIKRRGWEMGLKKKRKIQRAG